MQFKNKSSSNNRVYNLRTNRGISCGSILPRFSPYEICFGSSFIVKDIPSYVFYVFYYDKKKRKKRRKSGETTA